MKVIFLQTYPVYHDGLSTEQWLKLENRDKWMPALASTLGFESELWAVDHKTSLHSYRWNEKISVPVRLFASDQSGGRTKKHTSKELIQHARKEQILHLFLKGTDGGAGIQILRKHLLPKRIDWSFVVGGKFMSRFNSEAKYLLCETKKQRITLNKPGWFQGRFKKNRYNSNVMILPKSVDTTLFQPDPDAPKQWDVITAGRLMDYYKDYSALKGLSKQCKVAVIGGGSAEKSLKREMPEIDWIGQVPHHRVPYYLNRSRLFLHPSMNDHFPRVIPEAAACGVAVAAFAEAIDEDVLPEDIGHRIRSSDSAVIEIVDLLQREELLTEKGRKAREMAETRWHKESALPVIREIMGIS